VVDGLVRWRDVKTGQTKKFSGDVLAEDFRLLERYEVK
jgi:hypothetical protein